MLKLATRFLMSEDSITLPVHGDLISEAGLSAILLVSSEIAGEAVVYQRYCEQYSRYVTISINRVLWSLQHCRNNNIIIHTVNNLNVYTRIIVNTA